MFSKLSRYRRLPDERTVDAQGRTLGSKSLRLLPEAPGDFRHTVEQGERLDHVAHEYYRQPRKWWRICDANPEFLSPLALLGHEPLVTARFALTFRGLSPPWWRLVRDLPQEAGVVAVRLGTGRDVPSVEIQSPPFQGRLFQVRNAGHPVVETGSPVDRSLPDEWREAMLAKKRNRVEVSPQAIVLPHGDGWLLFDRGTAGTEEGEGDGRYEPRLLIQPASRSGRYDVFPIVPRYRWTATVVYNELNVELATLRQAVASYRFTVESAETIGRIGKPIIIPPDTLR